MLIAPPISLSARLHSPDSGWELALRYVAATAATLLAIAGAQLVTPNALIWVLTVLTLTGVPVSLALRLSGMRVGNLVIPRPLLNSVMVICSFGAGFYFVLLPMSDFIRPLLNGSSSSTFLISFGGGEAIQALMQLFLLFAAFRSFALISDKDATLTTVPSFSVLLLLIPIHKGIEVVVYFVAWTFVAATLFALDHRSEVREGVLATVPSPIAGQDVRLGARSLATILGVSLAAAIGISLFLASRDPDERSATETAVTALAMRLTSLTLGLPEASINSGPERQIDFKSGPTLPSRALLWQVQAQNTDRGPIFPTYLRMFTLSNYDGLSWTQNNPKIVRVPRAPLERDRWPWRRLRDGSPRDGWRDGWRDGSRGRSRLGFDIEGNDKATGQQFGKSRVLVRQLLISRVPNIGFLPVLPAVRALAIIEGEQKEIRSRGDGALEIGIVQTRQNVLLLSDVPPLPEYGIPRQRLGAKRLGPAQILASGIALAPKERELNLRLPDALPARVRELSAQMLSRTAPDASNSVKAQRLALEIQEGAVYTLRPPGIPTGRDATDYFLFEGARRGYCTYFAGALTVLCRAQGIPARIVSGFGGIVWNGPEAGLVREGNAHAWTEVWVDGVGWTIVDATPSGDRGDNAPTWLESWGDWIASGVSNATIWVVQSQRALGALALGMLVSWFFARRKRFSARWPWQTARDDDFERRTISQIYRRTSRTIARKFRPRAAWETPDEWLQNCAAQLSRSDTEALRRLTALYLAARYDQRSLPPGSARMARETVAGIGWKKIRNG